jgi:hypothetical protein
MIRLQHVDKEKLNKGILKASMDTELIRYIILGLIKMSAFDWSMIRVCKTHASDL